MSYKQAMRWQRTHRKGTRQPVYMSTGSGFWPSGNWIKHDYIPYVEACQALGAEPLAAEIFYKATSARGHFRRTTQEYAEFTKAGRLTEAGVV